MKAGDYRHRVEFQKNYPTTNAARQRVDDWRLFAVRKGRRPVEPRPVEVVVPDANRSVIETLVLHFRHDSRTSQITSTFRAIYQGDEYHIESVSDPDGLRREVRVELKVREFAR